jgi:hypothetical protein
MAMIDSVEVMARFGHRYPTLSEAHGLLNCLSESKDPRRLMLSEDEKSRAEQEAKDYIDEVEEFVKEQKRKAKGKVDISKTLSYISLGFTVAGVVTLFLPIGAMLGIVMSLTLTLIGFLLAVIAIVPAIQADKIRKELMPIGRKLETYKGKVKSDALRSRIERSIERIESLNDEFK